MKNPDLLLDHLSSTVRSMTHMRIRWRICANGRSAYAPPVGAYAFPKIVKFFQKTEKTLKIWMDISIQFLRHPFLSNMNNKIWFYQSSNFLGNRIFLSFKFFKSFWDRICANRRAHMRQRMCICITYRTV